ncbi:MAG: MFS transporter [Planctomycetota bacterium]
MKKWSVLAAGIMLQTILGGVYAWSEFVPGLVETYALSNTQCGFIFGVVIAVFTLVMVPAGRVLSRLGPRLTAGAGALLFASGYMVASFSGGNFLILLLGIGVLSGAGIGAGYVCPLTVAMKWFPDNRGLVTGVAVAGFGGGAVVLSYVANWLMTGAGWDVLAVFRLVAICFGGVAFISALFLSEPAAEEGNGEEEEATGNLMTHLLSGPFILLALGLFAGTFAGLLTVGNLKPILIDAGLESKMATLGISLFAFGNAGGRVVWGQIHDRLGSEATVVLSLLSLGFALIPLSVPLPAAVVLLAVTISGLGFGACFVVYASSMAHYFGVKLFPHLYPICFLGYGLAGIIGPAIGGRVADVTGSFTPAVVLSIAIVLAAAGILGIGFWTGDFAPVEKQ